MPISDVTRSIHQRKFCGSSLALSPMLSKYTFPVWNSFFRFSLQLNVDTLLCIRDRALKFVKSLKSRVESCQFYAQEGFFSVIKHDSSGLICAFLRGNLRGGGGSLFFSFFAESVKWELQPLS